MMVFIYMAIDYLWSQRLKFLQWNNHCIHVCINYMWINLSPAHVAFNYEFAMHQGDSILSGYKASLNSFKHCDLHICFVFVALNESALFNVGKC